jgi:hypothetical protein
VLPVVCDCALYSAIAAVGTITVFETIRKAAVDEGARAMDVVLAPLP